MTTRGHLLCLGYGYTADNLAPMLLQEGWKISGTTRSADKTCQLEQAGVTSIMIENGGPLKLKDIQHTTHLLISIKPEEKSCPALDLIQPHLDKLNLKSIIYLSSTGVYGNHDGDWIDEDTPATPDTPRGHNRLAAEQAWEGRAQDLGIPLTILRLAGIYGPGRNAINTLRRRIKENNPLLSQRIEKPGQYFNRIHVADISMTIHKILSGASQGPLLLNLCDDLPSPPREAIEYAAQLTGLALPPLIPFEDAALSPMARSFYADSKRLRNNRLKAFLGKALQYPTYQEGLQKIHTQSD